MTGIIIAAAVVGGVGLFIGIFLGVAGKAFAVEVDPREEAIGGVLPGNNCGGCGYAGCSGLAAAIVKGEGKNAFVFIAVDLDGNSTHYMIKTDKETVGEALLENGLIAGDDSEYGLYVKTVNGITLDYDKDGKYWAFYEENAYANQGVDQTPITEGRVYTFKPE